MSGLDAAEEALRQIRQRTAVHEAGHAVGALLLGWDLEFIEMCDVDVAEIAHADTWAFTRVGVPRDHQHDLAGVSQILAGYVAERFWTREQDDANPEEAIGSVNDVVEYVVGLLDTDGLIGDLRATVDLLDFNLDLPRDNGRDSEMERRAALEWAVRHTARVIRPLVAPVMRVAHRVEQLHPGARLDGAYIKSLCAGIGPS